MKKPIIIAQSVRHGRSTTGSEFTTGRADGRRDSAGEALGARGRTLSRALGADEAAPVDVPGRDAGRPRFGAPITPPRSGL